MTGISRKISIFIMYMGKGGRVRKVHSFQQNRAMSTIDFSLTLDLKKHKPGFKPEF